MVSMMNLLVFTVDKRLPYSIARYMIEDTRRLFTL